MLAAHLVGVIAIPAVVWVHKVHKCVAGIYEKLMLNMIIWHKNE
jgi:hypothetical protein